jgi:MFS transporter, NNP family, nitrate/nitrite transporter
MTLSATGAWLCLPDIDATRDLTTGGRFIGFVAAFGLLFAAAGLGNGSIFRMVTGLFVSQRLRHAEAWPSARARAVSEGKVEAAAVLGFASALGAYGGFFIPKSLGSSLAMTGSAATALELFILFYLSCLALTWWLYSRRNAPHPC